MNCNEKIRCSLCIVTRRIAVRANNKTGRQTRKKTAIPSNEALSKSVGVTK